MLSVSVGCGVLGDARVSALVFECQSVTCVSVVFEC